MGWEIGYDAGFSRWIGYGVVAWCDKPGCDAEIDRGLSYVCGGEPYGGETGCGMYFCAAHLSVSRRRDTSGALVARPHCARCRRSKAPYKPKAEHPDWIRHLLTDESWAAWRTENPEAVAALKSA